MRIIRCWRPCELWTPSPRFVEILIVRGNRLFSATLENPLGAAVRKVNTVSKAIRKSSRCAARLLLFLLGVIPLIVPSMLSAQIQNGEIVGVVTDPSGAVLVHAMVRAQNIETGQEITLR